MNPEPREWSYLAYGAIGLGLLFLACVVLVVLGQ